jgi:hypothetical protein
LKTSTTRAFERENGSISVASSPNAEEPKTNAEARAAYNNAQAKARRKSKAATERGGGD